MHTLRPKSYVIPIPNIDIDIDIDIAIETEVDKRRLRQRWKNFARSENIRKKCETSSNHKFLAPCLLSSLIVVNKIYIILEI